MENHAGTSKATDPASAPAASVDVTSPTKFPAAEGELCDFDVLIQYKTVDVECPNSCMRELSIGDLILMELKNKTIYHGKIIGFDQGAIVLGNIVEYRLFQQLTGHRIFYHFEFESIRRLITRRNIEKYYISPMLERVCYPEYLFPNHPKTPCIMLDLNVYKTLQDKKKNYVLIKNSGLMNAAIELMNSFKSIAVSGIGLKQGRLKYLVIDTFEKVFIFDFSRQYLVNSIRVILEDHEIEKIGFNLKPLNSYLTCKLDIIMSNYVDLKIYFNDSLPEVLYRELNLPRAFTVLDEIEETVHLYNDYFLDSFYIKMSEMVIYLSPLKNFMDWKIKAIKSKLCTIDRNIAPPRAILRELA